jgi:hypothetical protein
MTSTKFTFTPLIAGMIAGMLGIMIYNLARPHAATPTTTYTEDDWVMNSRSAVSNANYFGDVPPGLSIATDDHGRFVPMRYGAFRTELPCLIRTNLYEAKVACWRIYEVCPDPAPAPAWHPYMTEDEKTRETLTNGLKQIEQTTAMSFNGIFARLDEMRRELKDLKRSEPMQYSIPLPIFFPTNIWLTNTSFVTNTFSRMNGTNNSAR